MERKWTDYTTKTTPADNDEVLELSTDEKVQKRLTLGNLSDWILNKVADKVYSKLETNNKTLVTAINELNSKPILPYRTSISEYSSFYEMPSGIYFLYGDHYKNFSDIPNGVRGRVTWLYQNVRDERIGILLCAGSENIYLGKCYGGSKLTWVVK